MVVLLLLLRLERTHKHDIIEMTNRPGMNSTTKCCVLNNKKKRTFEKVRKLSSVGWYIKNTSNNDIIVIRVVDEPEGFVNEVFHEVRYVCFYY